MNCRDCGQPMHVYQQPCGGGKPPLALAECKNRLCDLLDVTLNVQRWHDITDTELDAYRDMVRALRKETCRV